MRCVIIDAVSIDARRKAVQDLVDFQMPVADALEALRPFGWDCHEELVIIDASNVIAILRRYLAGSANPGDIVAWADGVEGRDDLGYEEAKHHQILNAVFVLANPQINGELSPVLANELIHQLR